jgi:hypothetical protein
MGVLRAARVSFVSFSAFWAFPAFGQTPSPDLSSGGLAPPPAIESQKTSEQAPPGTTGTEQDLSKAEQADSGRGLEFVWLAGEVGLGHFGLNAFKNGDLVEPTAETQQTGLVAGAGVGVRVIFLTFGARFRYAPLPDFTLWTLGVEAGLHVPLGALEPYFTLGAGYARIQPDETEFDMQGVNARLGAGLDFYLTNMFSIGANLTGDALFLTRKRVEGAPSDSVYADDGSGIAGGVTFTAVMGLHF